MLDERAAPPVHIFFVHIFAVGHATLANTAYR
jgi:hypothetical protein